MPVWDPKANDLLSQVLECASEAEQGLLLDQACGTDTDLRHRVEQLLLAYRDVGSFLEQPAADVLTTAGFGRTDEATIDDQVEPTALGFLGPCDKPGRIGTLGPYEILEVVGRGGMGIVLRGYDAKLNRIIAIKVMAPELAANPTAVRRFLREAQAAAAVRHDHVITIHAVDDSQALPFLVIEFVEGQSLQAKIAHDGALGLQEILRIGMQAASGLAAAHKRGLVHRDVKPENILLEAGTGRVKITDFGLARAANDLALTQTGQVAGTPLYMSPEQAQGEPVDHRSDLFSLGSVLYAMCTGQAAFRADSQVAVLRRVIDDTPRPIREINPQVPQWLAAVIDKLLAKNPEARFQTADEVAPAVIASAAASEGGQRVDASERVVVHPTSGPKSQLARWLRQRPAVAAGIILAVLLLLGFSEAAGVTNLAATMIRIVMGEGTLVVEVNDPGISVEVDGEELTITGAGLHEIRLRSGAHQVRAMKDGKRIHDNVVTITRGRKQLVKVSLEGKPVVPVAEGRSQPSGAALRVLVDASKDGGVWWAPQGPPDFDPDKPHQGKQLADYVRRKGNRVRELPREMDDMSGELHDVDLVIRLGDYKPHSPAETNAYQRFVEQGGTVLLVGKFFPKQTADPLVDAFQLRFEETAGVITKAPESVTLLDWLDDQPESPAVFGTKSFGKGKIVFLSSTFVLLEIRQPFTDRLLAFLANDPEATRPTLVAPDRGAILDNGRLDRRDPIVWEFDWHDVPGASRYHLFVMGASAAFPAIDHSTLIPSSYRHEDRKSYIADRNRDDWRWKVRAMVDGRWTEWSEQRTFDVEPLDTDGP